MIIITFLSKDINFLKNYIITKFSKERVLKQSIFISYLIKMLDFFFYFFKKYFKIFGLYFKFKGKVNALGNARKRIYKFSRGKYSNSNMYLLSSKNIFYFLNPPGSISFFIGIYF